MNFETTFHNWLNKALSVNIPKSVKAFNFNLFETGSNFGIELIGSSEFDADDSDWACQEVFEANPRNLEIPIVYSGNNGDSMLLADCIAVTPPIKNDKNATNGIELITMKTASVKKRSQNTFERSGLPKANFSMMKYLPICSKKFILGAKLTIFFWIV